VFVIKLKRNYWWHPSSTWLWMPGWSRRNISNSVSTNDSLKEHGDRQIRVGEIHISLLLLTLGILEPKGSCPISSNLVQGSESTGTLPAAVLTDMIKRTSFCPKTQSNTHSFSNANVDDTHLHVGYSNIQLAEFYIRLTMHLGLYESQPTQFTVYLYFIELSHLYMFRAYQQPIINR
jgi:hypothetical protein